MAATADCFVSATADLPALGAVGKQETEQSKRLSIQPERTDAHVGIQRDRNSCLTRTEDQAA
jgi:hypothetical protein